MQPVKQEDTVSILIYPYLSEADLGAVLHIRWNSLNNTNNFQLLTLSQEDLF